MQPTAQTVRRARQSANTPIIGTPNAIAQSHPQLGNLAGEFGDQRDHITDADQSCDVVNCCAAPR